MASTILDRFLEPIAECLTPEVAQRIVTSHPDARTQSRLDGLAAKASAGLLTEEEREEYAELVEAIDLMGIFKARARAVLNKHAA